MNARTTISGTPLSSLLPRFEFTLKSPPTSTSQPLSSRTSHRAESRHPDIGIALFCLVGLAGAGYALWRRHRTATYLMMVGAMEMLGYAKAYVLLQPVAMGPAFEPYLSPGLVADSMWHVREFFPCRFFSSVLALFSRNDAAEPSGETV